MHELGILSQALEMALDAATREGACRILRMKLRVGALAGVVPEAMAFAFEIASQGTAAQGGAFDWEIVPVLCGCANGCPNFYPDDPAVFVCPKCGAPSWNVIEGRELHLVEIEVE